MKVTNPFASLATTAEVVHAQVQRAGVCLLERHLKLGARALTAKEGCASDAEWESRRFALAAEHHTAAEWVEHSITLQLADEAGLLTGGDRFTIEEALLVAGVCVPQAILERLK